MQPYLSEIWRYPVKSMRGQSLPGAQLGPRGLLGDREWMVVDEQGRFLTQRQLQRMALIEARPMAEGVLLNGAAAADLAVAMPRDGALRDVLVWRDTGVARDAGDAAAAWLSDFLGQQCRLVWMPPQTVRPVDPDFAGPADQVGFADGFPLLLITQASLDQLNRKAGTDLGMRRFRPNLVVADTEPHAEDEWRRIRIGEIEFELVKPCSRCIIPTIDPDTAERGPEPLRTLLTYRRRNNQIYFGQNLLHRQPGWLEVGAAVQIVN